MDRVGSEPLLSWKGAVCSLNHNEMGKEKTEKRGAEDLAELRDRRRRSRGHVRPDAAAPS